MDFADEFPSAAVIGTDISPTQPGVSKREEDNKLNIKTNAGRETTVGTAKSQV